MKAKELGRIELLAWINTVSMAEYQNINNLSDGVAFNHIIDAFYPNKVDFSKIKCKKN
jgi:hypothetical protein